MSWENGRQLSGFTGGISPVSYEYNDSGIRTKKTVGSTVTEYFVEGGLLLGQKTGSNVMQFLYEGGSIYGFLYNGTPYYYQFNGQGDVVRVLDQYGETEMIYTYDAWGKQLSQKDTAGSSIPGYAASDIANINPIRYRGYYYDIESGFYYLQSRYYDPKTGRFINADGYVSTGQGMTGTNMFAYCGNNPVSRVDPTGTDWVLDGVTYNYDGSVSDFHRMENGEPPRAYSEALKNGPFPNITESFTKELVKQELRAKLEIEVMNIDESLILLTYFTTKVQAGGPLDLKLLPEISGNGVFHFL